MNFQQGQAAALEEEVNKKPGKDWEYGELIRLMTKEIGKEKKTICWKGKRKPKGWWDKEVREAIEKRREASPGSIDRQKRSGRRTKSTKYGKYI